MSTQKRTFIPESDVTVEYGRDIKATTVGAIDLDDDVLYMVFHDIYPGNVTIDDIYPAGDDYTSTDALEPSGEFGPVDSLEKNTESLYDLLHSNRYGVDC